MAKDRLSARHRGRSRLHQTEELLLVDDGHMKSPSPVGRLAGAKFVMSDAHPVGWCIDIQAECSVGVSASRHMSQTRGRLRARSADFPYPGCSRSWREAHTRFA